LIGLPLLFAFLTIYDAPKISQNITAFTREEIAPNTYLYGNNWLRLNKTGNWECYIEGDAYERGVAMGVLQKELIVSQEKAFVGEINKYVPNSFYRRLLLYGIAWFNKDLDESIPQEYKEEIYGVSQNFSDEFDFIGPKFNRIINYHAAHDIGHMVQNMNLVACSAIAEWNYEDENPAFFAARNFDFYFGDDFAKNKIVLFCNPKNGYDYVSVSWGGLCGVVSGMNEMGLSVTLNSLPSEIPSSASTPVSIIAREVVQYASTIEEAVKIISKRNVFVSESFTIASAIDKKAVVVEKTPNSTDVFYPEGNKLIVTNHFQGPKMCESDLNKEHILESESMPRFLRLEELSANNNSEPRASLFLSYLRNQKGVGNTDLGLGNPMAINQLLAHHAVVFDINHKIAWISNAPWQENILNAYALENIKNMANLGPRINPAIDSLELGVDPFYNSAEYNNFLVYKNLKQDFLKEQSENPDSIFTKEFFLELIGNNPNYYEGYKLAGDHLKKNGFTAEAAHFYAKALDMSIPYKSTRTEIETELKKLP